MAKSMSGLSTFMRPDGSKGLAVSIREKSDADNSAQKRILTNDPKSIIVEVDGARKVKSKFEKLKEEENVLFSKAMLLARLKEETYADVFSNSSLDEKLYLEQFKDFDDEQIDTAIEEMDRRIHTIRKSFVL